MFKKTAIIGLGLMGASLALAIKKLMPGMRVNGYARRAETRATAEKLKVADMLFDNAADAAAEADLVVVCTPVLTICPIMERISRFLKKGCVVTDVGSTKRMLAKKMSGSLSGSGAEYIGSHPLAGSEQQGIEAANADLYSGAAVILTPADRSDSATVEKLKNFWEALDCMVSIMSPDEHDKVLARTSHLPHLAAAALASVIGRNSDDISRYCGKGAVDSTRIAAGGADIWHDIIETNRDDVFSELIKFSGEINRIADLIKRNDFAGIKDYLNNAGNCRARLLGGKCR